MLGCGSSGKSTIVLVEFRGKMSPNRCGSKKKKQREIRVDVKQEKLMENVKEMGMQVMVCGQSYGVFIRRLSSGTICSPSEFKMKN